MKRIFFTILLLTFMAPTNSFSVPAMLSHQGHIVQSDGEPMVGVIELVFTLYNSNDTEVWTETIPLAFDNGDYSVILGEENSISDSILSNEELYLGVAVQGQPEFSPRHRVVSVPYALRAEVADSVVGTVDAQGGLLVNGSAVIDSDGNWVGESGSGSPGESIIVENEGNVGIGTDTPGAKLEVDGNIIAHEPTEDTHVATKNYTDFKMLAKTSDYTILPSEVRGHHSFVNDGASGDINFTLPSVERGMKITIIRVTEEVLITPATGDNINGSGAEFFKLRRINSMATLYGINDTTWMQAPGGSAFAASSFGTGIDGDLVPSGAFNLNTDRSGSRDYADGIAYKVFVNPNTTTINIGTAPNGFENGDVALLINLQGTESDYDDVGNYEFLDVTGTQGNNILVSLAPTLSYDGNSWSDQKVIIQRIPQYESITIGDSDSITASAWDGFSTTPSGVAGYHTGIVAFWVNGELAVESGGKIDADGLGYRGPDRILGANSSSGNGYKGESFIPGGIKGLTPNGGGGGSAGSDGGGQYCAGGGGGGYGTEGVVGNSGQTAPGQGGLTYGEVDLSAIFLGSAGGNGRANNAGDSYGGAGGNGGGIVYLLAGTATILGEVSSNGTSGGAGTNHYSAGGGGGSGGSIRVISDNLTTGGDVFITNGGAGGNPSSSCSSFGGAGGEGRIKVEE